MRLPAGLTSAAVFALSASSALAQSSARDRAISDLIDLTMPRLNATDVFDPQHGPTAAMPANPVEGFAPGRGGAGWKLKTVRHRAIGSGGAQDIVRLTTTTTDARGRVALPAGPVVDPAQTQRVDLNYIRGWPSAMRLKAGGFGLDLTPHAGVTLSNMGGGAAEAGAMVRFGKGLGDRVKSALGIASDGTRAIGGGSHWYLFAGASGKAMAANMLDPQDSLHRSIMGLDQGGFQKQAQAGLGWRQGDMQASLGYVHEHMKSRVFGMRSQGEDRLALSLAFHPH